MPADKLMILDTASVYYRAYYALPSTLRDDAGHPVNAVRGLLDITATLVNRYRPDHLVCAWDADWRPRWRVDIVESYKAQRVAPGSGVDTSTGQEDAPADLVAQVPLIEEALALAGVPVIGCPDYEADDVAATLARRHGERPGGTSLIVTGDRDLLQLVGTSTTVAYLGRGVARHDLIDADWVVSHHGVRPDQYADYATLRGDASDGLPGAPGIGEKTASSLLARFGDLAGLLEAAADPASDLRPRVRQSLLDHADYLRRARLVTGAAASLPLTHTEALALPISDEEADRLAHRQPGGLGGSWARFVQALAHRVDA